MKKSRFVCVAGGVILIDAGAASKMAALVESPAWWCWAARASSMFGMVLATGIRILGGVDFGATVRDAMIGGRVHRRRDQFPCSPPTSAADAAWHPFR